MRTKTQCKTQVWQGGAPWTSDLSAGLRICVCAASLLMGGMQREARAVRLCAAPICQRCTRAFVRPGLRGEDLGGRPKPRPHDELPNGEAWISWSISIVWRSLITTVSKGATSLLVHWPDTRPSFLHSRSNSVSVMAEAYQHVAHGPIRNRGTLCGNLCHADPASEMPAVVLATDAVMVLKSSGGERRMPAEEFFLGIYETAAKPDELLVEVRIPVASEQQGWGFREMSVRKGDFALSGVAATLTVAKGKIASRSCSMRGGRPCATVAIGGGCSAGGCTRTATRLQGRGGCRAALEPLSVSHADAAYRTGPCATSDAAPCLRRRSALEVARETKTNKIATRKPMSTINIAVKVNGKLRKAAVPPRLLLSDFIRQNLSLTGTHVGCEHGVCGCCTITRGRRVRPILSHVCRPGGWLGNIHSGVSG